MTAKQELSGQITIESFLYRIFTQGFFFPIMKNILHFLDPGILCIVILFLFSANLKGQQKSIEKYDSINNSIILQHLKGIRMQEYLLRKNHHSTQNRHIILHKSREFTIIGKFDESCVYSFADSNSKQDINKVFGYSFGSNHHHNSFRIGWRCQDSLIEVLAYWYIKRENYNQHLFTVKPGKTFFINIKRGSLKMDIEYLTEGRQLKSVEVLFNPLNVNLKSWRYVNYPYFGGKRKPPHDMVIYLKAWMHR